MPPSSCLIIFYVYSLQSLWMFAATLAVWTRTAVRERRWCSATATWCKCTTTTRYEYYYNIECFISHWRSVHRVLLFFFFFPVTPCCTSQGKDSVYALTLENNNGTFEVTPAVIDRRGRFTIMVRNNRLLDFESRPSVHFEVKYNNNNTRDII